MSPGAPALDRSPRETAPLGAELPFALPAGCGGTVPALAAFALVLARHRGDGEVVVRVSTPAGSLPLRLDTSARASAAAFTARVGDALAVALAARTLPGASASASDADSDSDSDSDADADADADAADGGMIGGEGATVLALDPGAEETGLAGVALRIDIDEPLAGALEFDPDRVRPEAAARILAHFEVVRRAIAAEPDRAVLELPLLTDGERAERVRWNDTAADLPYGVCLHRAFEAHADADPLAPAALYGDESIAYGELEARANRLARHLCGRGVGPESRVGICVERGPRVLEAILGVLKAGGAYVPLDATYPPERLAGMVRTAGIRVLVTEDGPGAALEIDGERILLDRDGAAIAAESAERIDGGATPENLAYVIFTSGSTGEPKGIALAHRGVMNNLADLNRGHGVGPADRVLLLSSLSFDMSVYETLGILAAGGAVVVPRPHELRDPAAWAALCRRHGVTLWNSAPALLGMLCEHAEARPDEAPAGLRLAFLGGDWVPVPLVDRVRAWAPGMRDFIVMGGATEASIHSIIQPVGAVDPDWRSIPYGVPMANQLARVLDEHLREVPAGVPGELFLGGLGLARGYVGRAGFTAERFLPDPHAAEPGARIYRTGDLARYGEDGTIELLGRIDHQVKIRGFRIEPGEIESALRRHPGVARAVVAARPDGGESRLVAYLVRAEGAAPPEARELREMLRGTLPDYMVPAAYVVLDALPLSPNGKVDRKQLPAPPADVGRAPYEAPRTPAEAALAEIWAEVLGVERVGAGDDFFALGGQSLLATRVATRVRAALGVELPVRAVFDEPTLAGLARRVESHGRGEIETPITPVERGGAMPTSFAQERLWFLDRLQPESGFYNMPSALRLRGPLDAAALERALGEIVRRHEALRTVFPERDGAPVQVIRPFAGLALPVEDLSALDEAAREAAVRGRAAADAARPFDLAAGPLFRAALLRLGAEEHVLLLCTHHVVSDGWSLEVLFREMEALYGAFRDGAPSPLSELPVQYADYAAWQRARLDGAEMERQLAYWKARLAGAPELLEIPTDHPRPAVQSYRGGRERLSLPRPLVARLEALGRAEGATLYMVLLAAFQAVLARHAGSGDVVVGSPVAGRTRREVEGLIGFFVNTLALRADLSGDPTFREALGRVRAATLGAFEHQDVPFERVVAELSPERSLGHSPVVQVMFALQNASRAAPPLPGVRVEEVEAETGTTRFDLFLELVPDGDGLRGTLEYASDLFDPATARRILAHLARVLEQAAMDGGVRLSELDLLAPEERRAVLGEWSRSESAHPRGRCVHELFREQALRAPEAPAVVFGGRTLRYARLEERANRLARHLAALGVGPEARVAVSLERGAEMVVAFLAVLKAGGAYVPLDPGYPAERLELMLADSGAAVLLTDEARRGALPASPGVRVVSLDGDRDAIAAHPSSPPAAGVAADGLAYVIYTSGSTGTPKGVAVTHGAVVRLVRDTDYVRLGPADRVAQASSASFDAATFEVWGALLNGAALVGIPREAAVAPAALAGTLRAEGVTTLFVTTALFNQVALELPDAFGLLRTLLFGGEAVDPEAVRRVLAAGGPERLLHVYGPTENTTFSTWHPVAEVPAGARTVPIGRAVAGSSALVLDGALRPAPVGVPGELYLGGDGVARGYLGRPALTAERFVPDPYSAEPGARMYRTGDRVRWTAGGAVEFMGRLDGQVKIRGFRIEPGEVESALCSHPGVREARVVAREDAPGERRLVAYVVGGAGADALRAFLRERLPEYMVPAAFVALERLPLTPNGKLDRAALPAPDFGAAGERRAGPRTPVEEVLAGIWAEVLGHEPAGVRESFFDVGGHSLLATRVVSRIREVFGVEQTVRDLFEAPTLAGLAERVEARRRADRPRTPPVVPVDRTGPLPLSFAQERLWFLHRMEPASAFYNIPVALRLSGALDVAALERALGEAVRRHEALRTVFREEGGSPVQVIVPFAGFTLAVEDLAGYDEEEREAEAERRVRREAARPFDLVSGPLFRASLLRLGGEEHLLSLTMHHVASDGWSLEVLFRELSALYAAYREGAASPLAEPAVQYADFAAWQRAQLGGAALERQVEWWKARLAGAPALLELPLDHPRPAVQTFRGAYERVRLPAALLERLRALGRSEGATLYMVLLGAFQLLLSRYAGSGDVVVGTPAAGRTRAEVEGVVGFFVSTLVLRGELSGARDFREVVRRAREVTLGAYEHQDVPFERLVEELQPERSLGHSPLFQVMFSVDDGDTLAPELTGVAARRVVSDSDSVRYDLALTLTAGTDGFGAVMAYGTDLFERATVRRMLGHLERILEQVAADPDLPLSRLELMGPEERARVEAWSRADASYPDGPIHRLVEIQAAATPDAPAIVHEGESLTYAVLDGSANRLARRLRAAGVRRGSFVPFLMERGPRVPVAMLAALKAGAAFVPLDPKWPRERLRAALDGLRSRVLLAEEGTADLARSLGRPVMGVDAGGAGSAALDVADPDAGDPIYAIFTSGSTGVPKAAVVHHGGIANRFHWMSERFGAESARCVLQTTRHVYDSAVWQLLWPLAHGGRAVVPRDGGEADAEYLVERIEAEGVTMTDFVPSVFNTLVPELSADPAARGRLASLRTVVVGGEQITADTTYRFLECFPGVRVVNLYGPTECSIGSICHEVRGTEGARIPIGSPIAGTSALLLDRAGRLVPAGVAGEIHLGGRCVGLGYLGDPRKTAAAFVPDPFSAEPGARLYRTGDLARHRAGGSIEYLGRRDEQVKIRGFRIEPGEIEAALRRLDGVRECAVVAREDERGERRLAAYVVGGGDPARLRDELRRSLPDYMVPAAFVALDALPLTPNGKLDRRALPAPEEASAGAAHEAPRTPVEEVLAGLWAEVLRTDRVGVRENFFELGGHSLLATRVVSATRRAFGVEVPLRALFEAPTVAELAARVEALRRDDAPALPPVVAVERGDPVPLSFAQERLWFLDRMQAGSTLFNMAVALRLGGALDVPALERALGEVVRRHGALRTVFADRAGSPVQVIAPFAGLALGVEDLASIPVGKREAEVKRRADGEAAWPFDLAAGPLFRASLLRLDAHDHVLLLSLHHAVSDGWSMGVLFRELSALYGAYAAGGESPLPELAVSYADFAVWQREHLRGEALDRQVAWWRERMAGAPELLELPTDRPRPAVQTYRGAYLPVELPATLAERLRALARAEGATLYMVLLGAFQVLLSKYAGSEDVVVGTTIAGRTRAEVEPLVGLFMNTLVLRADLSGDPSFREALRRVRETTLGAYEHQDVPFERLVAELRPERSLSRSALFQVLFELENDDGSGGGLPGLEVRALEVETGTAKVDLGLHLAASERGIGGGFTYATDLFDTATVARMADHLRRVLEQVAADADLRLSRLRLVGEAERARVVDEWNRTGAEYPAGRCIHQLFEEQARRTPETPAVLFGGESMSYQEVDARANRLAHHLVRLGVGPEVRVALLLERGPWVIPAILAVMKAGGAYVPMDPAHPAERLRYVLEDSGAVLLLTQETLRGSVPVADGFRVVSVDGPSAEIPGMGALPPAVPVTSENLAYVIYTSGSTGRPKGVAMHHRGVANYIHWGIGFYGADGGNGAPVFSSMAVDLTITNLLPLFAGLPVHLLPEENAVEALAEVLRGRPGFGLIKITPVHLGLLTPLLTPEEAREAARTLVIGADFLSAESTLFWQDHAPGVRLMNEYGPTETVVGCSAYVLPNGRHRAGPVPVGHPIQNLRFYVLDARGEPVPVGLPGELYIGGAGVARGYLGRPAITGEKFVPDPFAEPGARMYRTGDRARWQADGSLLILGRTDHQVKIRGFRVELGEVEAVLRRHPAVSGCLAVIREDQPGDRRLVAYVVGATDAGELREHLRRTVPEYMVPSAFVLLDSLPETSTGKIDPKTLPAPEYASAGERYAAPRTPVEETLAAIWGEVLGIDRVGVHDDFFELGGHSLLALRMVARIREALEGEVGLLALFESPTIAGIAGSLRERAPSAAAVSAGWTADADASPQSLLASLDDLSEEELDRLLDLTS